jgi:branched-chain amino acid transport system ATP-binding protein
MSAFLDVADLSKSFGGVRAVEGMDLAVVAGTICGIIGPNGSGKTTLLGLLSGTYRPDRGTIRLGDRRLDGLPAHRTVQAGVARTFQTTRLFRRWTLAANLAVAAGRGGDTPLGAEAIVAGSEHLLELVGLDGRGAALCSSLSNAE